MPGYDETGPVGMGQMTGRGLGPCAGGMSYGRSRGFGGRGMGLGCGRMYMSRNEEKEVIEDEVANMEADLEALKERLSSLKGSK